MQEFGDVSPLRNTAAIQETDDAAGPDARDGRGQKAEARPRHI